jgi:hypothetical protein
MVNTFILALEDCVPELACYTSDQEAAEFLAVRDYRYCEDGENGEPWDVVIKQIEAEILETLKGLEIGQNVEAKNLRCRLVRVLAWN